MEVKHVLVIIAFILLGCSGTINESKFMTSWNTITDEYISQNKLDDELVNDYENLKKMRSLQVSILRDIVGFENIKIVIETNKMNSGFNNAKLIIVNNENKSFIYDYSVLAKEYIFRKSMNYYDFFSDSNNEEPHTYIKTNFHNGVPEKSFIFIW